MYGSTRSNSKYFKSMIDTGNDWIRIPIYWSVVEPVNTTVANYKWSSADSAVAAAIDGCKRVIITHQTAPDWAAEYPESVINSKNLGDRMLLGQYKRGLKGAGIEPLEERQEEELLAAMSQERENFEFSASFGDPDNFDLSRFTEENINTYLKEREELVRRVLDRSKTILTEEQFERYKASVESQFKMEKMQMEMAARMFGSKGSVGKTTEGSEAEKGNGEETGNVETGDNTDAEDTNEGTTGGE